jgi:hypothetical protein
MFKAISFFGLTALSLVYTIDFIYDSAYIEYFGTDLNQLFGSPAEYLAVRSILLLRGAAKYLTVLFFTLGFIACSIIPAREELSKRKPKIAEHLSLKSVPLIVSSVMVIALIIYPTLVIGIATTDAEVDERQFITKNKTIEYQSGEQ